MLGERNEKPLGKIEYKDSQQFDVIYPLSRRIVATIDTVSFTIRTLRLFATTTDLWRIEVRRKVLFKTGHIRK